MTETVLEINSSCEIYAIHHFQCIADWFLGY